jgi:hypothetical protein
MTNPSRHASQPPPLTTADEIKPARTMPVRSSRLPKNHSAGRGDDHALAHRPPQAAEENAPSPSPARDATTSIRWFIHRRPPVRRAWLCPPWTPKTTRSDSRSSVRPPKRQRPGTAARIVLVQPQAQRRAEQRGNRHRPADQPHHAQSRTRRPAWSSAPRLELARRPSRRPARRRSELGFSRVSGFVTHFERSRSDGEIRFPVWP